MNSINILQLQMSINKYGDIQTSFSLHEGSEIEENSLSENKSFYLEQFAMIVGNTGSAPLSVIYALSQLNRWFFAHTEKILSKYKRIYKQYAPQLARAEHRRLINQPIEYTESVTRTIPVMELQGFGGGILILDSQPPLFSDQFLAEKRPALTNICVFCNKPVAFFYKVGIRNKGIIRSGIVQETDYEVLEPYTDDELSRARERFGDDAPINSILPGRYMLDLQLELDVNPVLFHQGLFYINDLLLVASEHLNWNDCGNVMEPYLNPDLRVIILNFTHIVAHFKTVPTALIPQGLTTDIRNAKKIALVHFERVRASEETDKYLEASQLTSDDLLA